MSKYYDGTKLLSLKDLDGQRPEIYMVTTNRTGGKTTYFGRYSVRRFINFNEKFALLYRYNYELDNVSDKFFKDLKTLFFPSMEMTSKRLAHGIFHELYLNDRSCGYAITLNSADQLKRYSHLFSDVDRILFDEFQSETNHYCDKEVKKVPEHSHFYCSWTGKTDSLCSCIHDVKSRNSIKSILQCYENRK